MAEGQFSGIRRKFIYTSDTGEQYVLTTDVTLAQVPGCGLVAYAGLGEQLPPKPARFKPRVVHWQGVLDGRMVRKRVICGTGDSALYAAQGAGALTIDGVNGITTGRRGERLTY